MDEPCCAGVPCATETDMISARLEKPGETSDVQLFSSIKQTLIYRAVRSVSEGTVSFRFVSFSHHVTHPEGRLTDLT